jgi:hypothetical protein
LGPKTYLFGAEKSYLGPKKVFTGPNFLGPKKVFWGQNENFLGPVFFGAEKSFSGAKKKLSHKLG